MSHTRRSFLRAAGVVFHLPFLESCQRNNHPLSAVVTEDPPSPSKITAPPVQSTAVQSPADMRRMVAINIGLGLHTPNIIPSEAGVNYELPLYLQSLADHRSQFSVISGVSHPEVGGGHYSSKSFLTAARHPSSAGFRNSISLDQYAAEQLGAKTRFASLSLTETGPGLSWSRSGVEIPSESRPSKIYARLFLDGKVSERARQIQALRDGQSILDALLEQNRRLDRSVSTRDRQKLDQYRTSVREAEQRLSQEQAWAAHPKPIVDTPAPRDELDRTKIAARMDMMYDMIHLAIESNSTQFITYFINGFNQIPEVQGVSIDYHNLSHHGRDPQKLEQLFAVEKVIVGSFERFLRKLSSSQDAGKTLLDRTMVLFGSNLGNANSHDAKNMPIVLAGGQFNHGQHLAFDQTKNYPLANLYVSMLQGMRLETEQFASSTSTMKGLELRNS